MVASVLIEYSTKMLDKTFDYIVPSDLINEIKVGNKVRVPFGKSIVEGFVMDLKNQIDSSMEYKEIMEIVENTFCLNDELLSLGKYMKENYLSTLISCYQAMFPKALKASNKTNLNIKTKTMVFLNKNIDVNKYIEEHKRSVKEIAIINDLSDYNEVEQSTINCSSLKSLISKGVVLTRIVEVNREVDYLKENVTDVKLTPDQKRAYDEIKTSNNSNILLYGVTGSGKTEIYIKLIKDVIKSKKDVIMLVPEISLTPQIVNRFKSEFGDSVAVLHSLLSEGEKYDEYRRIASKEVSIVVGARSAVFATLTNIGLIIIDECSSSSFKQDVNPKYNAIDIAIFRAGHYNAKVIMGSATPSLEEYARGLRGVYKLVSLETRISNRLPKITTVDMNEEAKRRNYVISSILRNRIKEEIEEGHQVIILLNRRGYSTFMSCSSCGYTWKCPNCDISLIYHKSTNNLRCHYCGYSTKMSNICPSCHEDAIKDLGLGTEKLESLINKEFPTARVVRMDLDTTSNKGSHQKIIESFKNHEYDILVGTQMISKGLNFKDVSLVGVINADASLNIPDFRSSERTFELLMQTAGRVSRFDLPGEVIIQTYNKDNYVLKSLEEYNFISFYNKEMSIRKTLKYPPYYYLASIKISSKDYEVSRNEAVKIKNFLDKNLSDNFIILGPSTASVFKLKNNYYFQIIIKYRQEENLMNTLREINDLYVSDKVKVDININPLNLL